MALKEALIMPKTSSVFARVEPELKGQAEAILSRLGISLSSAVGMFLQQVVLQRGIPFELKLPKREPLAMGALTQDQLDHEISRAMEQIKAGEGIPAGVVEERIMRRISSRS